MWLKNLTFVVAVSVSALCVTQAQESWSWGADTSSDIAAAPVTVATEDTPETDQVQGRDGRLVAEDQVQDVNGRFLGIGDKLCQLGLGVHCDKKKPYEQNVNYNYQVKPHPSHSKYPNSGPAYNTPRPAYQAPYDVIKPSYVALTPAYPAPRPPKPSYTAPKPGYVTPYDTINTQYVAPQQPPVEKHVHSHTHIHQTPGAQSIAPAIVAPVHRPAPVAVPVYKPAYHELCECVIPEYCQTQDVIARRDFNDISHLLDPRSELKDGFESNATSTQGRSNFKDEAPEAIATTEEVERTKRETLTQGQNRTYNIEGRQFSSYNPGHNGCSHGHICCSKPVYIPPPPRPAPVVVPVYKPAYREQCECVISEYCQTQDVIARRDFNDISHLLDARSELKDGFESNATSTQGRSNFKDDAPESIATTEEFERTKRETLTQVQNRTYNIEGRQFSSYNPGHNGCSHGHICCRNPVYIPPPPRYTCGRSQSSGLLGRVKTPQYLKGDAEFAEYPWQAAILRNAGHETVYVCGAALIDEQHVLTAAHCIDGMNPYDLRIRLGEWDVTQSTEFFSHVEVQVANVIEHKDFYKGNLKNDIAIIRLAQHVDFNANPHISPVCLPDQYYDNSGQQCVVTGWGKDSFGSDGKFQTVLKEVTVPVVDHYGCQITMRQTRLGRSFNLDPGMLCAGGEEDKDACQGDGGSPLVCKNGDGSYQLTGLVSWGIGCGDRGIPGVYVNVKNYLPWIKNHTNQ